MNGFSREKRAEVRLPIEIGTSVTVRDWPLPNPAVTVNLNSNGALLRFEKSIALELGDVVLCDFAEAEADIKKGAPAHWARGEVVRISGNKVALQFLESSFFRGRRKKREVAA
jgi:PilZ domain